MSLRSDTDPVHTSFDRRSTASGTSRYPRGKSRAVESEDIGQFGRRLIGGTSTAVSPQWMGTLAEPALTSGSWIFIGLSDETYEGAKRRAQRAAFESRLAELAGLQRNWDGEGGRPPTRAALRDARRIASSILEKPGELPARLNLNPAADGTLLFTLHGKGRRELEIWIGQRAGRMVIVGTEGDAFVHEDENRPLAATGSLLRWLLDEA